MPNTTYTTNLNLTKPAYDDPADIAVINSNMDTIDTNIKTLQDDPGLSKNWVQVTGADRATILANVDAKFSTNGHFFGYATSTICTRLGLPSTNHYIIAQAYTASTRILHAIPYQGGKVWYLTKTNSTWADSWKNPIESEEFFTIQTGSTSRTQAEILEIIEGLFVSRADGYRFGYIASSYADDLGLPNGTGYYLTVISYTTGVHRMIQAIPLEGGDVYYLAKVSGTWQTEWTTNVDRFNGGTTVSNLNDSTLKTGIYYAPSTTTGVPANANYEVLNMKHGSYAQQIAIKLDNSIPEALVRSFINNNADSAKWYGIPRTENVIDTIDGTNYSYIRAGSSYCDKLVLSVPTYYRGFVVIFGREETAGIYMVTQPSSASNSPNIVPIGTPGEKLSYTTGAATVTFKTTSSYASYPEVININHVATTSLQKYTAT